MKRVEVAKRYKEIASHFPCCPANHKYLWKKTQIEKKANSALQRLRTDFWSMIGEECLNDLSLVWIHWDIFPDYDKIIDMHTSKYPRRMLLINPLSETWIAETFHARKTCKAYINFYIFSLYFIVEISKKCHFAWTN